MAPMANIILFEAADSRQRTCITAVQTAASTPGVVVVSMSWSGNEFSGETSDDSTSPRRRAIGGAATMGGTTAGGVTFLAAAGDYGAYASGSTTITPQYPACSPNVVAVGGTSLVPSAATSTAARPPGATAPAAARSAAAAAASAASGISPTKASRPIKAAWSTPISTTQRTYPDVSADANPNTGVPIYDSWDFGASTPWVPGYMGGTSLACPLWAGMVAVADQGRAIAGLGFAGRPQPDPAHAVQAGRPRDISTTSPAGNTHRARVRTYVRPASGL